MKNSLLPAKKHVSAYISIELHQALMARAKAENRPMTYIISDAIAFYLEKGENGGLIDLDSAGRSDFDNP